MKKDANETYMAVLRALGEAIEKNRDSSKRSLSASKVWRRVRAETKAKVYVTKKYLSASWKMGIWFSD